MSNKVSINYGKSFVTVKRESMRDRFFDMRDHFVDRFDSIVNRFVDRAKSDKVDDVMLVIAVIVLAIVCDPVAFADVNHVIHAVGIYLETFTWAQFGNDLIVWSELIIREFGHMLAAISM